MKAMQQLVSVKDVAAAMGVCERTVWRMERAGEITPVIRRGRLVRFDLAAVLEQLAPQKGGRR